jgi:hypothetical protein
MSKAISEVDKVFVDTKKYINLLKENEKLKKDNARMKEFVQDCAVSHTETRYFYRAKVILNIIG